MITGLEEVDTFVPHQVHDAVFFSESAGPRSRHQVLKRLGFADAGEGIAYNRLDQVEGWLETCMRVADLPPGRRKALMFMLSIKADPDFSAANEM